MPKFDPIGWCKRAWDWLLDAEERPYERDLAAALAGRGHAPAAESPSPAGCRYADGRVAAAGDTVVGCAANRLPVAGVVLHLYRHDGQITVAHVRLRPLRFLAGCTVGVVDLASDNPMTGARLVGLVTRTETFLAKDFRKIDAAELEKH